MIIVGRQTVSEEARLVSKAARQFIRRECGAFRGPKRVAKPVDLERLLREHGVPSTLPEDERIACEAAGLEMKLRPGTIKEGITTSSTGSINVEEFEKSLVSLSPPERVAKILEQSRKIAKERGWQKTNLSAKNGGREIYFDSNLKQYYAVDTQHGRFELLSKRGKHLGELYIDLSPRIGSIDPSGGHDIFI